MDHFGEDHDVVRGLEQLHVVVVGARCQRWPGAEPQDAALRQPAVLRAVSTRPEDHPLSGTLGTRGGSDENLHLIERLTRLDADTLVYEFTITDVTAWTHPWTAVIPLRRSEGSLFEYACHEGNHGMMGILSGARAEERAAAEAAAQESR